MATTVHEHHVIGELRNRSYRVSVKTTEKYYVDLVDDNYKSALDGLDKII